MMDEPEETKEQVDAKLEELREQLTGFQRCGCDECNQEDSIIVISTRHGPEHATLRLLRASLIAMIGQDMPQHLLEAIETIRASGMRPVVLAYKNHMAIAAAIPMQKGGEA